MTRRLILSYLSVVLAVLVFLEVPLGLLTERHERSVLANQAAEEATAVAVVAGEDIERGRTADLTLLARRYRAEAGSEVLITSRSGLVVDSDNDGAADRRTLRSEVAAAMAGRTATASVYDDDLPFTIAAVPVRGDPTTGGSTTPVEGAVVLYLPAEEMYARVHDVWWSLGCFALVVLALTAALGARLARSVSRPLARLQDAVARLGEGHLSERAVPGGPDELRRLASEFNSMAGRLEDLVTAQSRFVAEASHQLRSPLTAVRLRLENLESELSGAVAGSVAAANKEVQRLSRLVDGLLTLSRADGDRPERSLIDVTATIAARVEAWAPLADERGVRLGVIGASSRSATVPLVAGDLEQILDNLLANALDATPEGRSITVEERDGDGGVDIAVVDEGSGMSDIERGRAFDRFWQGPGHHRGSSGLGLAIVRQLAGRNGATVELLPAPVVAHLDGDGAMSPGTGPDAAPGAGVRAEIHLTR